MRTPVRIAAWAAAALVALYVAAALVVPRLVAADLWRPRIEERLSAVVGRPVALGTLRLTLWTGIAVRADRLTMGGSPSIDAGPVTVGIAWAPLWRREVRPQWMAVDAATIRRGTATLVEGSTLRARIGREAEGGTRVVGRIEGRVAAIRGAPSGDVEFDASFAGDRLDVRSFVARVGPHVVEARAGISGIRAPAQRAAIEGSARLSGVTLTGIDATLAVDHGLARLEKAEFRVHGGAGRATGIARFGEPGMPFRLDANVEGVDVESLASESFPASGAPIEGTLSATLGLDGRADAARPSSTLDGTAKVEIVQGTLRSVGLLEQAAQMLEMAGGKGLGKDVTPFDTIAGTFALRGGEAATSDLRFRSHDLDLDGGGAVVLDGGLKLDVVAAFSPAASATMAGRTPQLKFRVGSDGRLTVPMKIRGSIAAPIVQIDLDRVLKEGLQKELREGGKSGWLKKLLGRK